MLRVATDLALLTGRIGFNKPSSYGYINLLRPWTFEEQCEYQRILRDLEEEKIRYHCRRCGRLGHNTQTCQEEVEEKAA